MDREINIVSFEFRIDGLDFLNEMNLSKMKGSQLSEA